jgi:hypothetical protein
MSAIFWLTGCSVLVGSAATVILAHVGVLTNIQAYFEQ